MENYLLPIALKQIINAETAFKYRIIPSESNAEFIKFKTDDPDHSLLRNELEVLFDKKVLFEFVLVDVLDKFIAVNYRTNANEKEVSNISYSSDFLEKIVLTANEIGSSDIHFEPYEKMARIRYRLDGRLREQFNISAEEYPVIVNKIKIKAQLDISEKRLPQDGRITIATDNNDFDVRVSILPTLYGEKIVLRLLSKDASHINIDSLGFTKDELHIYMESIKKPNGIVLISGPTGSGKTTTLYATLKLLNKIDSNILTVEDPIEYTLEGINQVQLKENIGLDFASTLRTFLRQDPDIIMVGEIRDVATANMAVRAALTGHLVLSTIHTNSAWATVSRLIDMGIPPFLIAGTLNCSVAQRLVRKLCPICKKEEPIDPSIFPTGFILPIDLVSHYTAGSCNHCFHSGYLGRKAIYEILPITKELVLDIKQNTTSIESYIEENNIKTLKSNALMMISNGETSVEEVFSLLML